MKKFMKAKELYQRLENDFELKKCHDEWNSIEFNEYISSNFKRRSMGLLLDNSNEIKNVYTAVFPDKKILLEILSKNEKDVMIFTHHPLIWDSSIKGFPFHNIPKNILIKMKKKKISLYVLHVPLDKNGKYSTSVSLAKALDIKPKEEFCEYFGVIVGIIGKTNLTSISQLAEKVRRVVHHKIKVWKYGDENIEKKIEFLAKNGINTFITGVTRVTESWQPSVEFHKTAKKNKMNIIAATHYSTEKFSCIAMTRYFKKLGLDSKFVEGQPLFNDF